MMRVLILSKGCVHCQRLLDKYILKLVSSDIKMLFVEGDNKDEVNHYMDLAKAKLVEDNPDIEKYAYISPVLLLFKDENTYDVLAGFTLIDHYLSENL